MLFFKNVTQYFHHCFLRCLFIHYLKITIFSGKIINLIIDVPNPRFIQFSLPSKDGISGCRQQNIVIEERDKQLAPPIQELRIQINSTSATITNNISIVAIENNQTGNTYLGLYLYPITNDIVYRIIE